MANSKKIWAVAVVAVVIIAVALGVWWYKNEKPFDPSVDIKTFTTAGQFDDYYKNISEVYKKAPDGGKTPEETLQLFIDALKKGDTDLAAKYYIPEKQKKEAEDLRKGKEKGNLGQLISILEKDKKGSYLLDKNYYEFSTFDKNNVVEFSFSFVFNPSTNIWKIESL